MTGEVSPSPLWGRLVAAMSMATSRHPAGAVATRARAVLMATVLLASSLATGAAPAAGAPTWLSPVELSTARYASNASVATDGEGNATAVWSSWDGDLPGVQTAFRPAGGAWSAPLTISRSTSTLRWSPDLVVDEDGDATVVWVAESVRPGNPGPTQSTYWIQAVNRTPDGVWSPPVDLSATSSSWMSASLVVDQAGHVTAAWSRPAAVGQAVESVSRPPDGGWSAPATVGIGDSPRMAVDPAGEVTMTWLAYAGTGAQVRVASKPRGAPWSPHADLTGPDGNRFAPKVAVDGMGTTTVVWWDHADGVISTSSKTAGRDWTTPQALSIGPPGGDPHVAADARGHVWAMWVEYNGSTRFIRAATHTQGGTWSPPVDLSDPLGDAGGAALAASPEGNFVVAWTRDDGSHTSIVTARTAGASPWDGSVGVIPVADGAGGPRVDVDAAGNAVAVWVVAGQDGLVQAAGLDAAGPVLSSYAAPATGLAGTSSAFAAVASDVWSPTLSYAWTFGDGGNASGASVSHAYRAEGTYDVRLVVTDGVGNSTTRAATITISAPPPVAPRITRFRLTEPRIHAAGRAVPSRTRLRVRLSAPATLKVVLRSAHRHPVGGEKRRLRIVVRRRLLAGASSVVLDARVGGMRLPPDTYLLKGTAKNAGGTSPRKRAALEVVRPRTRTG